MLVKIRKTKVCKFLRLNEEKKCTIRCLCHHPRPPPISPTGKVAKKEVDVTHIFIKIVLYSFIDDSNFNLAHNCLYICVSFRY